MKYLLVFISLWVSNINYSQDTLRIPSEEFEEFFLALDTLRTQDSIKTELITELENTIKLHKILNKQDSLVIKYKDQEIHLLNEQIQLHVNRLEQVDKWYKKPWLGFVGGFASTIILIHTINYTLPQ